jgi:hypothetical protein
MKYQATGWFEIFGITNNSASSIQDLFHNNRLARYPRPQFIVFDNGNKGKFKREIKQMCDNYGIKDKPNTSHNPQPTTHNPQPTTHNPQANASIERVH